MISIIVSIYIIIGAYFLYFVTQALKNEKVQEKSKVFRQMADLYKTNPITVTIVLFIAFELLWLPWVIYLTFFDKLTEEENGALEKEAKEINDILEQRKQ